MPAAGLFALQVVLVSIPYPAFRDLKVSLKKQYQTDKCHAIMRLPPQQRPTNRPIDGNAWWVWLSMLAVGPTPPDALRWGLWLTMLL